MNLKNCNPNQVSKLTLHGLEMNKGSMHNMQIISPWPGDGQEQHAQKEMEENYLYSEAMELGKGPNPQGREH